MDVCGGSDSTLHIRPPSRKHPVRLSISHISGHAEFKIELDIFSLERPRQMTAFPGGGSLIAPGSFPAC